MADPSDYDDVDEFVDDCIADRQSANPDEDDDTALDACLSQWQDAQDDRSGGKLLIRKTHASSKDLDGLDFILSDETPDRYGDVLSADGWELTNFKKNPIALFGHNSSFPIGRWKGLKVENGALRGHLELAPAGTSDRIDEIRKLVEAGILRAVSVGFLPRESRARSKTEPGELYLKQELIETSLVSIPANPNAIAVAKSLKVSNDTLEMVFGKYAARGTMRSVKRNGEQAKTSRNGKFNNMSTLAQRIKDAEKRLVDRRDKLAAHLGSVDDSNVSDEQLETTHTLNDDIAREERALESLRIAEKNLGESSDTGGRAITVGTTRAAESAKPAAPRPFSLGPRKQLTPIDLIVRAGVAQYLAHVERKNVDQVRKAIYGDDEPTRAMLEYSMKAATAPAMTTVAGWAQELVQTLYASIMETLHPKTVFPRLSAYGLTMSFGRAGKISIPTRSLTPSIAGSFVGEGLPIPVRQGQFTSQILTPKKMAVITTWTREIDEHSVPAIEALLRDAIQEDTGVSLDTILLDTGAATTVRPAGILNGVSGLTPTAGGGFAALVGDIKQISGALLTATKGHVRNPVWLMNPQQVMSAGLTAAPGVGAFPFQDQINAGNLQGWPIIDSGTVPLGRVIALDAADFVSVGGEAPRFELSDQATLHLEDTTPLDIGTPGAPATVAAPVKSMWQTDSIALRLILPINWTVRRAGVVAYVDGVTW
jgi:HK97 family phage prohead protease/HK97 family phage major capsid protein